MSVEFDAEGLAGDLDELQTEVEAIRLPVNETTSVDRPALWNQAIGRLRRAVVHLLGNQALLLRSLQESADSAGDQGVDVKPADDSGGNGGAPAKE
jgi:hypothetical protein